MKPKASGEKNVFDIVETFEKYRFSVISTEGRNLINLKYLRFLVAAASRNDKIQRSLAMYIDF